MLKASKKFTGKEIDVADYSGVTKVNAASVTQNISIVGSSAANSLKGGKGKKIKITDASGKTSTQTYSGAVTGSSKLFADDNFISDDTNLDAIAEKKYSVTQIQTEEKSVAQDETLITYAEK